VYRDACTDLQTEDHRISSTEMQVRREAGQKRRTPILYLRFAQIAASFFVKNGEKVLLDKKYGK
jgi:hypothetical protein